MASRRWAGEALLLAAVCGSGGALAIAVDGSAPFVGVWPPVGIALAALYARGRRLWPGEWAGIFAIVYWHHGLNPVPPPAAVRVAIAAAVATVYVAQTLLGIWLLRKAVGAATPLVRPREIALFLLVAGPVHALLLPSVGTAAMSLFDPPPLASQGVPTWAGWWMSGTLGGLLFAPMGMALIGRPRAVWGPRVRLVTLSLGGAVLLTAGGFVLAREGELTAARTLLGQEAGAAAREVGGGLADAERAFRRFEALTGDELRADPPATVQERLQALRELVPAARPAFAVARPPAEGAAWQVVHAEPNGAGADPTAGPWPALLAEAGRTGRTATSPPDFSGGPGRVYAVVPCRGGRSTGPAEGFVAVELELAALARRPAGVLGSDVRLRLFDPARPDDAPPGCAPVALRAGEEVCFAGRPLTLELAAGPGYVARHRPGYATATGVVGLLLTVLLTALVLGATGQTALVAEEVGRRTAALDAEVQTRKGVEGWLRHSEARLMEAQRLARLGYWEWDPAADDLRWSPVLAEVLGFTGSDRRQRLDDLLVRLHPDDRAYFRGVIESMPAAKKAAHLEFRVRRPDGESRWLSATVTGVSGPGAGAVRGTVLDITERKRGELAAVEKQARLRLALHSARMGTWEWELRAGRLRWDERQEDLFGFAPGGFDGRCETFLARVHPGDRAALLETVRVSGETGEVYETEFRILRPPAGDAGAEPETRWVRAHGQALAAAGGAGPRMLGLNFDITEGKRAEEALRASEARLAEAQRLARLGGWEYDPHGDDFWGSREAYRLFGLPEGARPRGSEVLALLPPDDRARVEQACRETLRHGRRVELEHRLTRPDGDERVLVTRVKASAPPGRRPRVIGTSQDVTTRRREEGERRVFHERLQEAQKLESLGVLAGGVAHDFNNLLVAVLGNASLARELLPADSPLQDLLRPIEKSAEQAAQLCHQMLAYAGRGSVVSGPLDLNLVIEESGDLLRLAATRRVAVRLELAPELPPVVGDAGRLRQVVLNLVQNAAEAMGAAGGAVTVRTGHADRPPGDDSEASFCSGPYPEGGHVWLEVADSGPGMDALTRARVFEPFFSTKSTGRGLGLSAVHGIVRGHGGAICVTTSPAGTTFRVAIPSESAAAPAPDTATLRNTPRPVSWDDAHRLAALVADDEDVARGFAAAALRSLGLSVTEAATGAAALEALAAAPDGFAVVLLDATLPTPGGDALLALRGLSPGVPVILLGDPPDGDAGPHVYHVPKPFRAAELTGCVRLALDGVARGD